MAMDKSKENSRIQEFIQMNNEASRINIIRGIKNPAILKHFLHIQDPSFIVAVKYAMAAGIIDRDDVKWIKEHEEELLSGQSENSGQK